MSSPSSPFECHWRPSRRLLAIYLFLLVLCLVALATAECPAWVRLLGVLLCAGHAAWVLPRRILLTAPSAILGLRLSADGLALLRRDGDWLPVQLSPDSLALPLAVLLVYRQPGRPWAQGLCVPADAMDADWHRRLRVQLRFSRQRWAAPE